MKKYSNIINFFGQIPLENLMIGIKILKSYHYMIPV